MNVTGIVRQAYNGDTMVRAEVQEAIFQKYDGIYKAKVATCEDPVYADPSKETGRYIQSLSWWGYGEALVGIGLAGLGIYALRRDPRQLSGKLGIGGGIVALWFGYSNLRARREYLDLEDKATYESVKNQLLKTKNLCRTLNELTTKKQVRVGKHVRVQADDLIGSQALPYKGEDMKACNDVVKLFT